MERTPPFVEAWVSHQRRDEFWKQGSVCEDYSAITCPVYMVGGWTDAYRNAILRFLEGYPGPCKGLIGPWAHVYPESGAPGPAIGFLQEAVRWWDCHLKGIENGIMDEPQLRVYMPDAVRSEPGRTFWPGRWIATARLAGSEVGDPSPTRSAGAEALGGAGTPGRPERELTIRGAEAPASRPGHLGRPRRAGRQPVGPASRGRLSRCASTPSRSPSRSRSSGSRSPASRCPSDRPLAMVVAQAVRRLAGRPFAPHHTRAA